MKAAHLILSALIAGTVGTAGAEGPVNYPDEGPDRATPAASAATRAQVEVDLSEARRLGQIAYGELGAGESRHPATPAASAKTRTEVEAELAEARRLGLITYGEVTDTVATPEQEKRIAQAGRRAVLQLLAGR